MVGGGGGGGGRRLRVVLLMVMVTVIMAAEGGRGKEEEGKEDGEVAVCPIPGHSVSLAAPDSVYVRAPRNGTRLRVVVRGCVGAPTPRSVELGGVGPPASGAPWRGLGLVRGPVPGRLLLLLLQESGARVVLLSFPDCEARETELVFPEEAVLGRRCPEELRPEGKPPPPNDTLTGVVAAAPPFRGYSFRSDDRRESAVPIFLGVVAFAASMCVRFCLCRRRRVVAAVAVIRGVPTTPPDADEDDAPPPYSDVLSGRRPSQDPPPPYDEVRDCPPPYSEIEAQPAPAAAPAPPSAASRALASQLRSLRTQYAFKPLQEE